MSYDECWNAEGSEVGGGINKKRAMPFPRARQVKRLTDNSRPKLRFLVSATALLILTSLLMRASLGGTTREDMMLARVGWK